MYSIQEFLARDFCVQKRDIFVHGGNFKTARKADPHNLPTSHPRLGSSIPPYSYGVYRRHIRSQPAGHVSREFPVTPLPIRRFRTVDQKSLGGVSKGNYGIILKCLLSPSLVPKIRAKLDSLGDVPNLGCYSRGSDAKTPPRIADKVSTLGNVPTRVRRHLWQS